MEISIKQCKIEEVKTPCLALFINVNQLGNTFLAINESCKGILKSIIKNGDLGKKPGQTLLVHTPLTNGIEKVLLVSMGEKPLNNDIVNKIISGTANALHQDNIASATICMEGLESYENLQWSSQYLAEQLTSGSYCFTHFKKPEENACTLNQVTLLYHGDAKLEDSISTGIATGHGINVAKNLGNLPSNVCTPSYLAQQAETLANQNERFSTQILSEKEMKELGMNSFLSVAKGSKEEGKLIIMKYEGKNKTDAPYVLLGKGITFDSGGISLKAGARMDEMKFDMCGAASVMGVMASLAELKPNINVIGVIASAENMPSAHASKPGDIVTSMSGKTIEILNTDAEGRLVLCDALTYIERFNPKVVIDIATLTGACITALGHHTTGMMSNDDTLAENLMAVGKDVNDPVWRLPLGELYDKQLESNFADLANIGGAPAGTITAGCFLSQFAGAFPWAHMDIAGTAWKTGNEKGATGRPVSLLLNYLLNKESST